MNRKRLSIGLMVVSIAVIVAFQFFWLNKNYLEHKRLFTIHSNMLFRETIFKLQASKLHLDTNINIRVQQREDMVTMTNVIQQTVRDSSSPLEKQHMSVVMAYDHGKTSATPETVDRFELKDKRNNELRRSQDDSEVAGPGKTKNRVFDFLVGVDSLQDSISTKEIEQRFRQALLREGPALPFQITRFAADTTNKLFPEDLMDNSVTLGFAKRETYRVDFQDLSWYLLKELSSQIIFSFLLVGITIFSFLQLYRNWQQQKKISRLKNDFISNITHELKTPIATVSVAIEALKNFNALEDPVRTREYLNISGSELQRLSLLVDKVLKLSMFENEQVELKKEMFDFKQLVQEVLDSMRLQFDKASASSTFETSGNGFQINADKLHLTSVLYNLLDNALKYCSPQPSVSLSLKADPFQYVLSVADNGIGIPAEYQRLIFDKFFRIPSGDQHNVKGYGLGLSYVAYVLEKQGGSIQVESRPGKGSCFTIKIPRGYEQG